MLFLRPYSLKRHTITRERPKEADLEADGVAEKTEKMVDDEPAQPGVAPAAGDEGTVIGEARRSISKPASTAEGGDDAGTVAEEPEITKQ